MGKNKMSYRELREAGWLVMGVHLKPPLVEIFEEICRLETRTKSSMVRHLIADFARRNHPGLVTKKEIANG